MNHRRTHAPSVFAQTRASRAHPRAILWVSRCRSGSSKRCCVRCSRGFSPSEAHSRCLTRSLRGFEGGAALLIEPELRARRGPHEPRQREVGLALDRSDRVHASVRWTTKLQVRARDRSAIAGIVRLENEKALGQQHDGRVVIERERRAKKLMHHAGVAQRSARTRAHDRASLCSLRRRPVIERERPREPRSILDVAGRRATAKMLDRFVRRAETEQRAAEQPARGRRCGREREPFARKRRSPLRVPRFESSPRQQGERFDVPRIRREDGLASRDAGPETPDARERLSLKQCPQSISAAQHRHRHRHRGRSRAARIVAASGAAVEDLRRGARGAAAARARRSQPAQRAPRARG